MLPKYIKVNNFASYIEEEINFNEFGDLFVVMGENGAGKSTVIHMITTCIFFRAPGTDAKGSGMEELIHQGSDGFKIEYCFEMNKNTYIIIREKTKKSQTLKLFINGEDHSGKLSETQQKVNDIIKMDYDTFMDTIIIGQGESASFMKKSATERKKIIAQILRLDKYSTLETYTKNIKKELNSKLLITETKMENLYTSISNKDSYKNSLSNYKNELIPIEESITKMEEELENVLKEKAQYEQFKKQQTTILSRISRLKQQIENSNLEIKKLERFKVEINQVLSEKNNVINDINENTDNLKNITIEINSIKTEMATIKLKNSMLNDNITNLRNRYSKLKNYNECSCQFCGQNISEDYKEQHLLQMKDEGVKYETEFNSNKKELELLNSELNQKNSQESKIKKRLLELDSLKTRISQAEIKIETVTSKLDETNNNIIILNNELNELNEIEITEVAEKIFRDNYIRNDISDLRSKFNFNNSQIGVLENRLEEISENEKVYKLIKEEFDKLKEDIFINDQLLKAWSKNGIQAIIIDNILPQIEDEINKYLKILSDDKITLKFKTEKEAKNGNKSETLDIIVSDSKGSRAYERYSGGQKTRIDFACHIGMSKFLAKRSGSNIDFFVVDEGIGTLDESGKQNFLDTVRLLTSMFKQVMVISHIPDIIESFENKVIITNDIYNGSKINVLK